MNHLFLTIVMTFAGAAGQVSQPGAGPAAAPPATAEQIAPEVSKILSELERAGDDVRSVRCRVAYTVDDKLNLTRTVKYGDIFFKRAEPHPMFLVHFDKTVADDIVHRDDEWWLFRDRWLSEAKARSKTIIKREMISPEQAPEVFDLDKSPIPMPFGQKEEEIAGNFRVQLMAPQLNDPPNCDRLKCDPREGSRLAEDFRRIEYYVSHDVHLPVRIVAEDADGNKVTTAVFEDLTPANINVDLKDSVFQLPKETKDYNVTEEPLKPTG